MCKTRWSTGISDSGPFGKSTEKLIRVACYAPSGHNLQPVRWLVIREAAEVSRLVDLVIDWMKSELEKKSPLSQMLHMDRLVASREAGEDRICRGAPHVIVAYADKNDRTAPVACTIALTYLELAASAMGLGACWGGYFNAAANMWPDLFKALKLPEGQAVYGAMMVGRPKFKYHRIPYRKEPSVIWG